ncbi:MAG: glycosyltransferase family 4 protein [bacterium]|nr:glycosyltransferase family 4 protein [bacterium]
MRKKRIGIYLERRPDSGGAYQYCLAMLKSLASLPKGQYEIVAFIMYEEWRPVTETLGLRTIYAQKNKIEKVIYHLAELALPVAVCRRLCRMLHPFARALRRERIETCIYPCADKISFMMDTPAVVSVFDLMHRYLTEFPEISAPEIYKSRERSYTNIARYAKMILVDSEIGRQQMLECYGEQAADLADRVYPLPFIAPDYVYESVGKPRHPKPDVFETYIFYPAQFWKHKNHGRLLEALALLKKEGVYVNLVCSGTGKNGYEEVCEKIRELDLEKQVKILGYVSNEEMVALYQYARALVMPTFGGPTNIPQLEAFVLGTPVATSRIFGIPEQVGDAALLFDPADVNEIAECVKQLWQDDALCEELVRAGQERAAQWGERQFAKRLHQYLEEL